MQPRVRARVGAPESLSVVDGGAKPHLTSGGEAVALVEAIHEFHETHEVTRKVFGIKSSQLGGQEKSRPISRGLHVSTNKGREE